MVFSHLIISKIDNNGDLKWTKLLPKDQLIHGSYILRTMGDKAVILYNDLENNITKDYYQLERLENSKDAVGVMAVVQDDGTITRQKVSGFHAAFNEGAVAIDEPKRIILSYLVGECVFATVTLSK